MNDEAKILRAVRRILGTPEGENVLHHAASIMDQLEGMSAPNLPSTAYVLTQNDAPRSVFLDVNQARRKAKELENMTGALQRGHAVYFNVHSVPLETP